MSPPGVILFLFTVMKIQRFEVGPFAENTYMLSAGESVVLVDPGFSGKEEFRQFTDQMEKYNGELKAVLLTHAHVDHVLGLHRTLSEFEVPVYLSHKNLFLWNNFSDQARMFGFSQPAFGFIPDPLPDNDFIAIGDIRLKCLYTPGHAPDHVSFYHPESSSLICGDALFRESVGRTDLYEGDMDVLKKSIREQLFSLPVDTVVYPGHGPSTTIGHEKQHNPFVGNSATSF